MVNASAPLPFEGNPAAVFSNAGDISAAGSEWIAVVAKSFAGQGLGSRLLTEACNKLRDMRKQRIYVDRHEENLASVGMMRKSGFVEIDTYEDLARRSVASRRTTVSCYTV